MSDGRWHPERDNYANGYVHTNDGNTINIPIWFIIRAQCLKNTIQLIVILISIVTHAGRYMPMNDRLYRHVHDQRELGVYHHVHIPYDGGYGPYSHIDNPYIGGFGPYGMHQPYGEGR